MPAPRWVQRLYLLVICVMFATCVSTLVKIRLEQGPTGEAVPSKPPQEVNRASSHELQLSMVLPENWELESRGDQLHVHPKAVGRIPSALFITRIESPSETELNGFQRIVIQDAVAYEKTGLSRRGTLDDPSVSESTIFMKVGQQWLQVILLIQDEITSVPPMILQYLQTIRVTGPANSG